MKITIIICSTVLLLSCGQSKSGTKTTTSLTDSTLNATEPTSKFSTFLLAFNLTDDPNFCDPKKGAETDSYMGEIYFTNKGNVVHAQGIPGPDTLWFQIGTYKDYGDSIVCKFTSEVTVPMKRDKDNFSTYDMNYKKAITSNLKEAWTHTLMKNTCKEFPYFIKYKNDNVAGVWFYNIKLDEERGKSFLKDIKALELDKLY